MVATHLHPIYLFLSPSLPQIGTLLIFPHLRKQTRTNPWQSLRHFPFYSSSHCRLPDLEQILWTQHFGIRRIRSLSLSESSLLVLSDQYLTYTHAAQKGSPSLSRMCAQRALKMQASQRFSWAGKPIGMSPEIWWNRSSWLELSLFYFMELMVRCSPFKVPRFLTKLRFAVVIFEVRP